MKNISKKRLGRFKWTFYDADDRLIEMLAHINLDSLEQDERTRLIKKGPSREVYKIAANDTFFYVKKYKRPTFFDTVKYLFRPSKGAREFATNVTVYERDVNAPKPVACVSQRKGGFVTDDYMFSEEIPHTQNLRNFLVQEREKRRNGFSHTTKRKFTTALADFVSSLHDNNIYHKDFHPGNVLFTKNGEIFTFYILDLDNVVCTLPVDIAKRIKNLASFNVFFSKMFSPSDRLRFLKSYTRNNPELAIRYRELAITIEEETRKRLQKRLAHRLKRCTRNGKYFKKVKINGNSAIISRRGPASEIHTLLENINEIFDPSRAEFLKKGNARTVVAGKIEDNDHIIDVVIKRSNQKNAFKIIKDIFRPSHAVKNWKITYALQAMNIPVLEAFAVMDERRFRILRRSYFVMERLIPARNLKDIFAQKSTTQTQRNAILESVARMVRKLHSFGYTNRDLKYSNLLLKKLPNGIFALFPIDFDGVRKPLVMLRRYIHQNIARFFASVEQCYPLTEEDIRLFLRAYLGWQATKERLEDLLQHVRKWQIFLRKEL